MSSWPKMDYKKSRELLCELDLNDNSFVRYCLERRSAERILKRILTIKQKVSDLSDQSLPEESRSVLENRAGFDILVLMTEYSWYLDDVADSVGFGKSIYEFLSCGSRINTETETRENLRMHKRMLDFIYKDELAAEILGDEGKW